MPHVHESASVTYRAHLFLPPSLPQRQALAQYLHQQKGNILLLLSEGWETTTTTTTSTTTSSSSSSGSASSSSKSKSSSSSGNVNAWLQPLGLHAHDDAVLRARRHPRYPHPKEVFLTLPTQENEEEEEGREEGGKGFSFVYPYGCSLSVRPPAKVGREGEREEGREGEPNITSRNVSIFQ